MSLIGGALRRLGCSQGVVTPSATFPALRTEDQCDSALSPEHLSVRFRFGATPESKISEIYARGSTEISATGGEAEGNHGAAAGRAKGVL